MQEKLEQVKELLLGDKPSRYSELEKLVTHDQKLANMCFTDGLTPLTYAVARNDFNAVKLLVDNGARLSILSGNRLIQSKEFVLGNEEKEATSLEEIRFFDKSTEFSYALQAGQNDLIGILLDALEHDGYTEVDKKQIVNEMLIATINHYSDSQEKELGSITIREIVEKLLAHGAVVDHKIINSVSDTELCRLLIQKADMEERERALYYGLHRKNFARTPLLLPELSQDKRNALLFSAIDRVKDTNDTREIDYLLNEENRQYFEINASNEQGYTPLMWALLQFNNEINEDRSSILSVCTKLLQIPELDLSRSFPKQPTAPYSEWTALEFAVNSGLPQVAQHIWKEQKEQGRFVFVGNAIDKEQEKENEPQPLLDVNQDALQDLCAYLRAGAKRTRNDRFYFGIFAPFGGYNAGEKQDAAIALFDVALGLKSLESLYESEDLIGPLKQGRLGEIFSRVIPEDQRNEAEKKNHSSQYPTL